MQPSRRPSPPRFPNAPNVGKAVVTAMIARAAASRVVRPDRAGNSSPGMVRIVPNAPIRRGIGPTAIGRDGHSSRATVRAEIVPRGASGPATARPVIVHGEISNPVIGLMAEIVPNGRSSRATARRVSVRVVTSSLAIAPRVAIARSGTTSRAQVLVVRGPALVLVESLAARVLAVPASRAARNRRSADAPVAQRQSAPRSG